MSHSTELPMTAPVVYTCVTRGYDKVRPVPGHWACRFMLFHDGTVDVPEGWTGQRLAVRGIEGIDLNRYAKMQPHRLNLGSPHSMYVDGNVAFHRDPHAKIESALSGGRFAAFKHPARACAYSEMREALRLGFIGPAAVWRHARQFRRARMPERRGLFEAGLLIRRHDDPAVVALDDAWWRLWQQRLGRDQPLLAAALWEQRTEITPLGDDIRKDPDGVVTVSPHARLRTRRERIPNRLAAEMALFRCWLPR